MKNHFDPHDIERLKTDLEQETLQDEDLKAVAGFLRQWQPPAVNETKKALLLQALKAQSLPIIQRQINISWVLLLQAQMRIVRGALWLASALVMAVGAFVTALTYTPGSSTFIFVLVAPLVAALGISFIYGEDIDPPTELLLTTPISPRIVLLARIALVFGFNLGLALCASFLIAFTTPHISLLPLIAAWLAPMAFLSALAFLMSVLFNDPLVGVLVSMGIWAALCIRHLNLSQSSLIPDVIGSGVAHPLLFLLTAVMAVCALWLAGNEENRLGRKND
jgi:hypothetical protein